METGIRIYPITIDDKLIIEEVLDDNDQAYVYDRYEDCYFIPEAAPNCNRLEIEIWNMFDDVVCDLFTEIV